MQSGGQGRPESYLRRSVRDDMRAGVLGQLGRDEEEEEEEERKEGKERGDSEMCLVGLVVS